jgi:hypothetical protein
VHGAELWRLRWENVVFLMFGESWPDNDTAFPMAVATLKTRWVWAPLFVVALVVFAVRFRQTRARPLVPALIGIWFVCQGVALVAINEGRYRKPLEGLLVAQVLVWCDAALEQRRARRRAATATGDRSVDIAGAAVRARGEEAGAWR